MTGPLVVVGDALLDRDIEGVAERLCPDAPVPVLDEQVVRERPGGAALAAYLAARASRGREVVFVTALGDDEVSARLRQLLAGDVTLVELSLDRPPPEKTRIRAGEQPLVRLDRGGGGAVGGAEEGGLPISALDQVFADAEAVLVIDYGHGVAAHAGVRARLGERRGRVPLVWDPHPRGAAPVLGATVVTPSLAEARVFADADPEGSGQTERALSVADRCGRELARRWGCSAVAITLGAQGALLTAGGTSPLLAPAPAVAPGGDTCGAGDSFAVAVAHALADSSLPSEAVLTAVGGAAEFVAAGGAATAYQADYGAEERRQVVAPSEPAPCGDASDVVARTRASGGTVVATGGCFDLLHAGHVATLQAARELGACLVVCLNSDASVRRLKGPSRPVNTAPDRAAVLSSLACVDAVEIFDEPTPETALARLRPDVWVKGGDYGATELPESPLLSTWGGQTVVLPYVGGHSSTRMTAAGQGQT